ncbi:MAG: endolytic transglycosylase MltG [bacterium]|nr:endolytic transglycosylase MltG [bacterium]MDE0351763.1 endolytic transglycosylase MltG [bacterium]
MSAYRRPDVPPEGYDGADDRWWIRARGAITGLLVAAVVSYALVVGGTGVGNWVNRLGGLGGGDQTAEVVPGRTVVVEIPSGSSARSIAGILVGNGVVPSAIEFESLVRTREAGSLLKAGTYELVTGTDLDEIVDLLIAGPSLDVFRVTVVEGLRLAEVLDVLAQATRDYSEGDFTAALLSGDVTSAYLPAGLDRTVWEGLLFPATYEFFGDATPAEMLQRLATELERRLETYDWSPVTARGLSVYEGLVMASLVEAEAGTDEDRPLIASVINNRLARGMPLQIDATVLYAMADRGRSPTLEDLRFESPYNTYLIAGLPPTPIGAAGAKSIEAVIDPADTDYLYYVLTSEDGAHSFFSDYDDFLVAKQQADALGIG